MGNVYRPTTLRLASRHCPRAVDYYELRRPYFREHYSVGIAAHAVLDVLGQQVVRLGRSLNEVELEGYSDAAARVLLVQGREFDGEREPPMSADDVFQGRDLAIRHVRGNPFALTTTARYELGAGFTRDWRPTAYKGPETRFRLIFDFLDQTEIAEEEQAGMGVLVRDYKSAWPTSAAELDTIQMRAQAVCASLLYPALDFVRQEVVNLRTGEVHGRTLWYEDQGPLLAQWQRDLAAAMDALDEMQEEDHGHQVRDSLQVRHEHAGRDGDARRQGSRADGGGVEPKSRQAGLRAVHREGGGPDPAQAGAGSPAALRRPARPGAGCIGCPWVTSCEEGNRFAKAVGIELDPVDIARRFAASDARRQAMFALAKRATEERPVELDGAVVGTVALPGREAREDAAALVYNEWARRRGDLPGFLAALRPGVTTLEGVARRLAPRDREAQDALLQQWTTPKTRAEFGVHRKEK